MRELVGKTIERVEEAPTEPKYGYRQHGSLLLHFTDGSAAMIVGSSYEEVDLSCLEVDDPQRYARAAQGRREKERLERLKQQEFKALPVEEQEARRAARRERMSPFARIVEDQFVAMAREQVAMMNRPLFGDEKIRFSGGAKKKARRS